MRLVVCVRAVASAGLIDNLKLYVRVRQLFAMLPNIGANELPQICLAPLGGPVKLFLGPRIFCVPLGYIQAVGTL